MNIKSRYEFMANPMLSFIERGKISERVCENVDKITTYALYCLLRRKSIQEFFREEVAYNRESNTYLLYLGGNFMKLTEKYWEEKYSPLMLDTFPPYGRNYGVPCGMSNDEMNIIVDEFMNLAKTKQLSNRQIQHIFRICSDRVLDFPFD